MALLVSGNKVPLYTQIAQTIKQRVRTGQYPAGQALPSVRTMCREFGVSVKAVHQAVRLLEDDGVVTTHPGKGVTVTGDNPCEKAALFFGVIHPYSKIEAYQQTVLGFVDEAFGERFNFSVVRSSKNDPAQEKDLATHLVANGAKGLLLWPASDDPNGLFFQDLARKVPVVLVDRLLAGADLPGVVMDHIDGGRQIVAYLLGSLGKRRLLVLMDDLHISPYEELVQGIRQEAADRNRSADVTIVQLPISSSILLDLCRSDFSRMDIHAGYVDRLMREGGYDAVFCTQGNFINDVLVEAGVTDRYPGVQYATMRGTDINTGSRRFNRLDLCQWFYDYGRMVSEAAAMVQRWTITRQAPRGVVRIKPVLTIKE